MSLLRPVDAFDHIFFEQILKISFNVSTILNSKSKIETKKTDTCKHFYKKDFHVFSSKILVCYLIGKNIISQK